MEIHLHNTRSGRRERFEPQDPDRVTMYLCGPTVYNLVHIGNAVPAVCFDVLVRLLRLKYGGVRFVRNITDVDDKINAAALASGESIGELADRYADAYREDVRALGVLDPDVEPRATEHIGEIVAMIGELIDAGHAYAASGHVLFHVPSDPNYGSLSHRSLEDMIDGARVEVAPYKRDPKDFVLWKPSTEELPGWESPWGRGRPGWHIECSAMIRQHLGRTIDIHAGGNDLTFPHHENEQAQSTCAHGTEFVRYWLHNGMLSFGGTKMSKSLGNVVTIRGLLGQYPGEVLRYALLLGHYRQTLQWEDRLLVQARASLDTLYGALRDDGEGQNASLTALDFADATLDEMPETVVQALADDLNTPRALAAMHALAADVHRAGSADEAGALRRQLLCGGWLLGLLTTPAPAYFRAGAGMDEAEIERRIEERRQARADRDFARADAIRDGLAAQGIELEDTRSGTRWRAVATTQTGRSDSD